MKTESKKLIPLSLYYSFMISDVKGKIQYKEGIHPLQQQLLFRGEVLADEKTLSECGIKDGDSLQLLVSPTVQITVKGPMRSMVVDDLAPQDTIQSVKVKIQEKEGIPPSLQRLSTPRGIVLQDCTQLTDCVYNIDNTLHLEVLQTISLHLKGKTFTMMVWSSDSASEVKARIEEKIGIDAQVQTLTHEGKELRDDVRMSGFENITLLCGAATPQIKVTVTMLYESGYITIITLEASPFDTVDAVTARIQEKWGIPPHVHVLKCGGEDMKDGTKLMEYKIRKRTTLYLLVLM